MKEFKGKWYVDIREFYDAGGELKPTKKGTLESLAAFIGVFLPTDSWKKLISLADKVNSRLAAHEKKK